MQMLYQQLPINQNFTIPSQMNSSFVLLNIALDLTSNEAALFFLPETINNERKISTQRSRNGERKEILIAELNRVSGGVRSINLSIQFGVGQRVILKSLGGTVHIIGGYKKYQQAIQPITHQQKVASNASNSKQVEIILNQNQDRPVNKKQTDQQVQNHSSFISNEIAELKKKVLAAPQEIQPLRRSTRARAPPKPVQKVSKKSAKKQKEQLKNMASYFECNLDDDQDESFSKSDQEVDEDDDESDSQSQQQEQIERNLRSGRKLSNKDIQEEGKRRRNSNKSSKSEQTQATAQIEHFPVPTKNPYV